MEKIPANKARQGRWGYQVFLVLVVGLVLASLVWVFLEFYGEAIDTRNVEEPGAVQSTTGQPSEESSSN